MRIALKVILFLLFALVIPEIAEGGKGKRKRKWRNREHENTKSNPKGSTFDKCNRPPGTPAEIIIKKNGLKGQYIVVLCNSDEDNSFYNKYKSIIDGPKVIPMENTALYTVECKMRKLKQIAKLRSVKEIEQESFTQTAGGAGSCTSQTITAANLWGLDRIGGDAVNKFDNQYKFNTRNQDLVDIYVIDTGVKQDISFGGRVLIGSECRHATGCKKTIESQNDVVGHGTHVAGIAASNDHGVAKRAMIIPVKLIDFFGVATGDRFSVRTIVSALSYVLHKTKLRNRKERRFSVVNMSLGGPRSACVNDMVDMLFSKGILVVAAAGNERTDASRSSPGSAGGAFTVSCTARNDAACGFGNFGPAVDILAPGLSILSVSNQGGTSTRSGTSMSTPHVTGAVAVLMAQECDRGKLTPEEIRRTIKDRSTKGVITRLEPNTPNELLFVKCD